MNTTAAAASIVAAVTGITALVVTLREARRRRLVEVIDVLTEIKAAIDWGGPAALKRDEAQGRLRTRLARLDLPKTREFASAKLWSEVPSSRMADAAIAEARAALDKRRLL
jgi:hypothetical protein